MQDPLYSASAMTPAQATPAAAAPLAATPLTPAAQVPPAGFLHTVVAGDSIWKLAQRYGVTPEAIIAANPGVVPENLLIGSVLRIPAPGAVTYIRYTVKPGDTLWLIGQRYGVPWQELARINRIMDPMNLMVGTTLLIPVM
ncbi:MAG: LysM peptidoglycan-binding domain-containing protein [Symbiobacteriia bacterium]